MHSFKQFSNNLDHCHDHCFNKTASVSIMFQSLFRMASAEAITKLETKAIAAERLIELLRKQINQVRSAVVAAAV